MRTLLPTFSACLFLSARRPEKPLDQAWDERGSKPTGSPKGNHWRGSRNCLWGRGLFKLSCEFENICPAHNISGRTWCACSWTSCGNSLTSNLHPRRETPVERKGSVRVRILPLNPSGPVNVCRAALKPQISRESSNGSKRLVIQVGFVGSSYSNQDLVTSRAFEDVVGQARSSRNPTAGRNKSQVYWESSFKLNIQPSRPSGAVPCSLTLRQQAGESLFPFCLPLEIWIVIPDRSML